jgi:hypothetical protein
MNVLVISHERSGTHFLIDSIVKNIESAIFPKIRPSFSSLENLFLPHDQSVTDEFYEYTFETEGIKIFKTHMLPEEIETYRTQEAFFNSEKDLEIIKEVYENSYKIYIKRDVKDVLVSLFYYMKKGGGLHNAMKQRVKQENISDFIRSTNFRIMPSRGFEEKKDGNLVKYWNYHNSTWKESADVFINYRNLKKDFVGTIEEIAKELNVENELVDDIQKPEFLKPTGNVILDKIRARMAWLLYKNSSVAPRKGVIGDYKNHFSKNDLEFIEKENR